MSINGKFRATVRGIREAFEPSHLYPGARIAERARAEQKDYEIRLRDLRETEAGHDFVGVPGFSSDGMDQYTVEELDAAIAREEGALERAVRQGNGGAARIYGDSVENLSRWRSDRQRRDEAAREEPEGWAHLSEERRLEYLGDRAAEMTSGLESAPADVLARMGRDGVPGDQMVQVWDTALTWRDNEATAEAADAELRHTAEELSRERGELIWPDQVARAQDEARAEVKRQAIEEASARVHALMAPGEDMNRPLPPEAQASADRIRNMTDAERAAGIQAAMEAAAQDAAWQRDLMAHVTTHHLDDRDEPAYDDSTYAAGQAEPEAGQ